MGFFTNSCYKQRRWNKKDRSKFPIQEDDNVKESLGMIYDVLKDLFYRVYDIEKKLDPTMYEITKMNRITPYADESPSVCYVCTSCNALVAIPRLNAPDWIQCLNRECQGI